ncbi:MAG: hypothetical protein IKQ75_07800 [Bacteroidales bacterium]|nr:hypothetical protein [Bacteroidales bacterium]
MEKKTITEPKIPQKPLLPDQPKRAPIPEKPSKPVIPDTKPNPRKKVL